MSSNVGPDMRPLLQTAPLDQPHCYFSHMTLIFNQICLQNFPSNQSAKGFSWVMFFFLRVWRGQNQSGESRAGSPALGPKLLGHYRRQRPTCKRPRLLQQEPRPRANRHQAGIWACTRWQGEAQGARTPKLQVSARNTTTFSETTGLRLHWLPETSQGQIPTYARVGSNLPLTKGVIMNTRFTLHTTSLNKRKANHAHVTHSTADTLIAWESCSYSVSWYWWPAE